MALTVFRGAGDKIGEPVVEPLLSDDMLIHRGTYEMDKQAQPKTQINASVVYHGNFRLGQLVSVADPSQSEAYRAKIVGVSLQIQHGNIDQTLTLDRYL